MSVELDQHFNLHPSPGATLISGAPQDVVELTHPIWAAYPPSHPFMHLAFASVLTAAWVASTVGNSVVVYVFLKAKELRSASNMLVVALALSDLIMINTHAPPAVYNAVTSRFWIWGKEACKLYGFLGGVFGLASALLLLFIGYDRHNVIVLGLTSRKLTPTMAAGMIAFSFVYPVATVILPLMDIWGKFELEGYGMYCSFDYLTINPSNRAFVLFLIVGAVVTHERALREQAKRMNVDTLRANKSNDEESVEFRIAKASAVAVLLWWFAYTPYTIAALLGQFGGQEMITPTVAMFPALLLKIANCFNPIIYAFKHPKYREALATHLPCLGIGSRPQNSNKGKKSMSDEATVATTAT